MAKDGKSHSKITFWQKITEERQGTVFMDLDGCLWR